MATECSNSPLPKRLSPMDRRRARELYRYFRPDEWTDKTPGTARSPNVTLTAYAQLVAIRLNAQRAIISLIDKDMMFFVAEATKSTNLGHTERLDQDGNGLWVGCAEAPKAGRLCEWTIALEPLANGVATLVAGDMEKDPRFANLDFVTGPPYFRLYAGTPLTTKRGINIGSLYVLDDKPRDKLSSDEVDFLGTMASTVITYLETQREADVGRRMSKFNQGLNCFVEGKSTLSSTLEEDAESPFDSMGQDSVESPSQTPKPNETSSSASEGGLSSRNSSEMPRNSLDMQQSSPDIPSTPAVQEPADDLAAGYPATFARAANLMREGLELDEDGGVVFFDANNGVLHSTSLRRRSLAFTDEGISTDEETDVPSMIQPLLSGSGTVNQHGSFTNTMHTPRNSAKILAVSTSKTPTLTDTTGMPIWRLDDVFLQDLLSRYPKGKMWVFDETGDLSSSEDDALSGSPPSQPPRQGKRNRRKQTEASMLLQQTSVLLWQFPGVRQLLFVPLWDAASSQWFSGCFCWSTSETKVFTKDVELTFLSNFGKSIMAECSRLDTIMADQQKSDFIGSVSHELRSPLHGILASAEFLGETDIDTYQRSLADTIDACGRTLLDTINHVLDFSKINSFARTWKKDKTAKMRMRGPTEARHADPITKGAPPLLNIYAVVDVAAIAEEVVEGVSAGHLFDNISRQDITDVGPQASGRTNKGHRPDRTMLGSRQKSVEEAHLRRHVEVILDVETGDWTFMTQPGALRRVIMNIFGNSLKYTEHGMIRVALKSTPLPQPDIDGTELGKMVTITISDTGKGISPEFLRSKLYTPFAQENSLAPGTGLGLSIVRGIVTMLGGTISIRSEVGRGSSVTMSIPLLRPKSTDTPSSTSTPMSVNTASQDDSIDLLHREAEGRTVAICGAVNSAEPYWKEAQKCLVRYLTLWFGLPAVQWLPLVEADVVIVDENDLPKAMETHGFDPTVLPGILVLCNNAAQSRRRAKCDGLDTHRVMEFIAKPYGPYKLAKALLACLRQLEIVRSGGLPTSGSVTSTGTDPSEVRMSLDNLALGSPPGVQINGGVTTEERSAYARKAFSTPIDLEPAVEFPFPEMLSKSPEDKKPLLQRANSRKSATSDKNKLEVEENDDAEKSSSSLPTPRPPIMELEERSKPTRRIPSILLVDDNKINLRLLQTFMKKRKYELVDSADDGKMAVDAFTDAADGYDIIFMDISMPIMNGFQATEAIRAYEEQRRLDNGGLRPRPPAMIIALTGLASGRDQSQAFTSGIDLYITKPASFKEVAKLLDNWEANVDGT